MRNILKLTGITGSTIYIDSRCIFAISEMEPEEEIPEHVVVFTDKANFRVANEIESIIDEIKNINKNELIGL